MIVQHISIGVSMSSNATITRVRDAEFVASDSTPTTNFPSLSIPTCVSKY